MGWPHYHGRVKFHDFRAIMTYTRNTLHIAFTVMFSLINNQDVDIAYSD